MSDETRIQAASTDEACDEPSAAERDSRRSSRALAERGVALSVLWWLDGDGDDGKLRCQAATS